MLRQFMIVCLACTALSLVGGCSSSSSTSTPASDDNPTVEPVKDSDLDLITDDRDNCPIIHNPEQMATIGDATDLGDACDDEDADGIVDASDNCPTVANGDQLDSIGDGVGDACRENGGIEPQEPPASSGIDEPEDLYTSDGYDPVSVIRVDIRTETTPGICTADNESGCTLADVLADIDKTDDLTVDIPVHFKSDDFPDDGLVSNAELRLRGGGSRFAPQKSFRIKLDSKQDLWRGERYLQLNKHPFESSRIRNKLSMDIMSQVPHLPSFRTQFVNLWIDNGSGPEDYGLFTHVERVNKNYLEKRGWDDSGNLYKANNFSFDKESLSDMLVNADGVPLDKDRFETSLEIENGDDHRTLLAMMEAMHNPERTFESVFNQYFDRDNALAWVTTNILLQQYDITRHNFILYNPSGSEKFYFIPWDYDAAIGRWEEPPNDLKNDSLRQRLEYGYAVVESNPFLRGFYSLAGMHEDIVATAQSLRNNNITDQWMSEKTNTLAELVAPFQQRVPDSIHNTQFNLSEAKGKSNVTRQNFEALTARFGLLMPPLLSNPRFDGSQWHFEWQPAIDVTGVTGLITYTLQISTSPTFETDLIVLEIEGIEDALTSVSETVYINALQAGKYYARLIALPQSEPERYWQVSGNKLFLNGVVYYGPVGFQVP